MNRRQLLAALPAAAVAGSAAAQQPAFPRGAIIRSLLKDHAPEEFANGATLFHEHMSLRDGFLNDWSRYAAEARAQNAPPRVGPAPAPAAAPARAGAAPAAPQPNVLADEALMTEEMATAKREGIACLVDGGHTDMGRDVAFLRRISQASGMPIVASAGFYAQPFYPAELSGWSETRVFEEVMNQVRANPTGALGEIGSWDYITRDERKVFRAIGRVQRETGLPIFTHTGIPGKSALEQLDLLEDGGADLSKVIIGHLNSLTDLNNTEIQRAIMRRGATVGFDRQGGAGDAGAVAIVKLFVDMGYERNIMFASDLSSAREMKRNGGGGYAKTLTVFAPKLREAGVSEASLRTILYDNPRRWLAFVPKIPR